jgi:hypothetical protein
MNKLYGLFLGSIIVVLTGCYESSNFTVHKPGVYKGASDPLLSANAEERAGSLNQRFKLGQLDR